MQKGYWISCYREIYDAEKLAAYAELAKPAIGQLYGYCGCQLVKLQNYGIQL